MVEWSSCWTPRQCAAIAGIFDIVVSSMVISYTYMSLSYNTEAAECLGLNSLYRYGEGYNESQNSSDINEFVQLTFNKSAVRYIFIPPGLCTFLVGTIILVAGLMNKYWMTIISCILTSVLIGGLIPLSVGLIAMEIRWLAIAPFLICILVHLYFLYILTVLAELEQSQNKSFENIVYYTGPQDIEDGIIMKTETIPSILPVIVISKPRFPTPAPDATGDV